MISFIICSKIFTDGGQLYFHPIQIIFNAESEYQKKSHYFYVEYGQCC
jgi:hypothetical protein